MKNYSLSHNGIIYTIDKEETESNDVFMKRAWYIAKRQPKTQKEFDDLIPKSYIWRNINTYKCSYPPKITKLL